MPKYTLISCGKLYDGIKDEMQSNMRILVEDNKIAEVGKNVVAPANAEKIDLSGVTVTPGMIDAHVHFQHFDWKKRSYDVIHHNASWKAMAFLYNARKSLARGFTSIRTVGSSTYDAYGVINAKKLINLGYFEGSRLVALPHYHYAPGSHGDQSQYLAEHPELSALMAGMAPTMGCGVDFFRNSVREQVKYGADFVKIMATGGFSTPNDSPDDQQLSDEEMKAIIDTAHELHKTCTAHVYSADLIKKLARMGIDGLEHGSLIDKEASALLEERNIYLISNMAVYDDIINLDEKSLAQKAPYFREKLISYQERLIAGRKVILESNMRLGYGTDYVTVHHAYDCGYEYESWMKSKMDPYRILKAVTSVNAGILEMEDRIGTIEPGKFADIAAWGRDLLTDPKALLDCAFVMKDGVVYPTEKSE